MLISISSYTFTSQVSLDIYILWEKKTFASDLIAFFSVIQGGGGGGGVLLYKLAEIGLFFFIHIKI